MTTKKNKRQLAGVRFVHLRDTIGRWNDTKTTITTEVVANGGATIAYIDTVDSDDNPITYAAVAYCHPTDRYNKELGRAKSEGLLVQLIANKGNLIGVTHLGDEKYFTVAGRIQDVLEPIVEEVSLNTGYCRIRDNK